MSASDWRKARGLGEASSYAHGTRARYVCGCRCDDCRGANRAYYHERQTAAKLLAAEISPSTAPAPQLWTAPDGSKRIRVYARACPGVGAPCPLRAHLRKDSKGGVCRACRERLVWKGLVPADLARKHLLRLRRQGLGRRAVAAAADVGVSIVAEIANGRRRRIRARTERQILQVDCRAIADAVPVPATRTWVLIGRLLKEDYTRGRIARELGAQRPALQLGRRRVLASTALRVERLYRRLTA